VQHRFPEERVAEESMLVVIALMSVVTAEEVGE
jgi:hypothetical protein